MKFARISGIGMYVPPRIIPNAELEPLMDTSHEWIQQRTGIQQRHWVDGTTSTSDLALQASREALREAGIQAEELELIILATLSPDHVFPGTACFLQNKLGIPGIPALDVRQQCSGFIYGLSIAESFIRSGKYSKILLVGAEVHSKGLDKSPVGREVSVLFGDGAGAVVLTAGEQKPGEESLSVLASRASQIYSTHLHADGAFAKELWIDAPSMEDDSDMLTQGMVDAGRYWPKMNGKTVFVHAVKRIPEVISEALQANNVGLGDVDLFILHQANLRINEMVAKQMGIPAEKVFNTIERFGNTTAATIPIGLYEAKKAGVLKPGMLVCSAAFGSGFTWASALFRW